jgi:hypothetical protein
MNQTLQALDGKSRGTDGGDLAGFGFIYRTLRGHGLAPWCAARLAWRHRGRWPRKLASERLAGMAVYRQALLRRP